MIRILLLMDVVLFRRALVAALAGEHGLMVVGDFGTTDAVLSLGRAVPADVLIVDLDSRGIDDESVRTLCDDLPNCSILGLTTTATPEALRRAIESRVRGYITKDGGIEQLVDAVHRVAEGERVIEPASAVMAMLATGNPLTDREMRLLRLAAEYLPVAEIAKQLCLSPGTIRNYLSVIVRKVGARNRLEAIRIAERSGWL